MSTLFSKTSRVANLILIVGFALTFAACQPKGKGVVDTDTQFDDLPPGIPAEPGPFVPGPGLGTPGAELPDLIGLGVPESVEEAEASGVDVLNLPQNLEGVDVGKILADWSEKYGDLKPLPLVPTTFEDPMQIYIRTLHCTFLHLYGTDKTPNYAYLMGLYLDILGRAGDMSGIQGFQTEFPDQSVQANRLQIATRMLNSPEYNRSVINHAYLGFLRRNATEAEFAAGLQAMSSAEGQKIEDYNATFVASRTFIKSSYGGDGKVRLWFRSLYRDLLNRAPKKHEVDFYARLFMRLGQDRKKLALRILRSDELRLKFIVNTYLYYLDRVPSAAEAKAFLTSMRGGMDMKKVIAEFAASQEYKDRQVNRFGVLLNRTTCN